MSLLLCRCCGFALLLYRQELNFKKQGCDFTALQVQFFFVKNRILRCPHKLRRQSHLAMHYQKLPYFMIYWSISGCFILKPTTHYSFSIILIKKQVYIQLAIKAWTWVQTNKLLFLAGHCCLAQGEDFFCGVWSRQPKLAEFIPELVSVQLWFLEKHRTLMQTT